ncbi:MAG: DUF1634 domain-containing protein [Desulfonauticus sp.]|nr:DUF1634 domain-containing protein [Desulfonauticus sp.]
MSNENKLELVKPLPHQITYANILFWGAWGGICLMTITYILYVFHIVSPHIDVNLVVQNWDKGIAQYRQITNSPQGWDWVLLLGKGDFLNFLGISLLALLTIVCYIVLFIGYIKKKDKLYATIAFLEILVLSLAATGILGSGGH